MQAIFRYGLCSSFLKELFFVSALMARYRLAGHMESGIQNINHINYRRNGIFIYFRISVRRTS